MCQLLFCPMDDKTFGILQFCVPNKDASVCCFWTDVTGLAEPLCSSYLALKITWNKIRIDQQQNFSNTFASLVTFAAWTESWQREGLSDVPLRREERSRCRAEQARGNSLLFISALSAQGRAAVALSTAWHSAASCCTRPKAKSTFIFLPAGSSVDKQATRSHTGESSLQASEYIHVSLSSAQRHES